MINLQTATEQIILDRRQGTVEHIVFFTMFPYTSSYSEHKMPPISSGLKLFSCNKSISNQCFMSLFIISCTTSQSVVFHLAGTLATVISVVFHLAGTLATVISMVFEGSTSPASLIKINFPVFRCIFSAPYHCPWWSSFFSNVICLPVNNITYLTEHNAYAKSTNVFNEYFLKISGRGIENKVKGRDENYKYNL